MPNYKMEICYDGTRYYGWERQPDKDTIQGKLENVLSRMADEPVEVIGSGRTDAGVHARHMIANAHINMCADPEKIREYMNNYLPDDICVMDVKIASDRFHARYNAIGKLYVYTCYVGDTKPVFDRRYVTKLDYVPDVDKMKSASEYLIGTHDFKSFCGNPRMKKSTVRNVDDIEIIKRKDYLYFNVHGTGFLQNMVRIIVGTLLEVGKGSMSPEEVKDILEKQERKYAGPTAPPQGLALMRVDY